MQYALPGIAVTDRSTTVPLDHRRPDAGTIGLFVRELVDPCRRDDELPLLTFLMGGPGGANPRPLRREGWLDEALDHYRVVLVDQRGTGRSTPLDGTVVARLGDRAADYLALHRVDAIVQDLEHVRTTMYGGRRWATLGQSYGGFITLRYLSVAPEGLSGCYITGGIPGMPPTAAQVYRRTFDRVARKTAEYYRRYPQDVPVVTAIADRLAAGDVQLPDGDLLTVERFQSLGLDLGMKPGATRMHWLIDDAFAEPGRLSEGFLAKVLERTSSASNPLFWTLQEAIYGDSATGATGWAAQAERDRRPEFDSDRRPLQFTGEMAFPWMFEQVRLLRPFADAAHQLAQRSWPEPLYDVDRLRDNGIPVAAVVYFEDMYVDSGLSLDTLSGIGNAQAWVTNEYEHDGISDPTVFARLRDLVIDRGGEIQ